MVPKRERERARKRERESFDYLQNARLAHAAGPQKRRFKGALKPRRFGALHSGFIAEDVVAVAGRCRETVFNSICRRRRRAGRVRVRCRARTAEPLCGRPGRCGTRAALAALVVDRHGRHRGEQMLRGCLGFIVRDGCCWGRRR